MTADPIKTMTGQYSDSITDTLRHSPSDSKMKQDDVQDPIRAQRTGVKRQRSSKHYTSGASSTSCSSSSSDVGSMTGDTCKQEAPPPSDQSPYKEDSTHTAQLDNNSLESANTTDPSVISMEKIKIVHDVRNKRSKPEAPKFLLLLYEILQSENASVIKWAEDGLSLQILDPATVTEKILPKYFNHTNFHSFQRQLNYFGFRKWTKSKTDICTFSHPHFRQNQPELLQLIKRKKAPRRIVTSPNTGHSVVYATNRPESRMMLPEKRHLYASGDNACRSSMSIPNHSMEYRDSLSSAAQNGSRRLLPLSPSGKRKLSPQEAKDMVQMSTPMHPALHRMSLSSRNPLPSLSYGSPSQENTGQAMSQSAMTASQLYSDMSMHLKDTVISPVEAEMQKKARKSTMSFYPSKSPETYQDNRPNSPPYSTSLPTLDLVRKRMMYRQQSSEANRNMGLRFTEGSNAYNDRATYTSSGNSMPMENRMHFENNNDPVDLLLRIKKCHQSSPSSNVHSESRRPSASISPNHLSDTSILNGLPENAEQDLSQLHNFLLRQSLYSSRLEAQLKVALEENKTLRELLNTKLRESEGMQQEQRILQNENAVLLEDKTKLFEINRDLLSRLFPQ